MPQWVTLYVPILAALTLALGAFFGALISKRATGHSTEAQTNLQVSVKIAEFRQQWINTLRDCMAEFQAICMMASVDRTASADFYRLGAKIELLMNRADPEYKRLHELLYRLFAASEVSEEHGCNAEFINICQDILKREWEKTKNDLTAIKV